jgi:hypothetical protein
MRYFKESFVRRLSITLFLVPAISTAQIRESSSTTLKSSLLIVRSSGSATGTRTSESTTSTRRLTTTELAALISPLGYTISSIAGPWTVSLQNPVAASGRVTLSFFDVKSIHGDSDPWIDASGQAQLQFRAFAAGESYLIDCALSTPLFGGSYSLSAPGGGETTTTTNHLMAIYEAPDTQVATFVIQAIKMVGGFSLDSCTISRVVK